MAQQIVHAQRRSSTRLKHESPGYHSAPDAGLAAFAAGRSQERWLSISCSSVVLPWDFCNLGTVQVAGYSFSI